MSQTKEIMDATKSWNKRLDWDSYFMSIAFLSASRSPCNRLNVGCVIVKDKRIVCTGYNGYLPNAPHESVVMDNHEQAIVHAEQNSVADCAKRGVSIDGATAYVTHFPCINCFKILVASGVKYIVYAEDYKNLELIHTIAKQVGVTILQFPLPRNKEDELIRVTSI